MKSKRLKLKLTIFLGELKKLKLNMFKIAMNFRRIQVQSSVGLIGDWKL